MSLKDVRTQLNMTQAEFSSVSGLSLRSIQAYEQGRKLKPQTKHLLAYNLSKFCVNCKKEVFISHHCSTFDGQCFCYAYSYFLDTLSE